MIAAASCLAIATAKFSKTVVAASNCPGACGKVIRMVQYGASVRDSPMVMLAGMSGVERDGKHILECVCMCACVHVCACVRVCVFVCM